MKIEAYSTPIESKTNVIALASIVIEDRFKISDIRIMKSAEKGDFVAFPSYKNKDGEYKDICFPVTSESYATITNLILDSYKNGEKSIGNTETEFSYKVSANAFKNGNFVGKADVTFAEEFVVEGVSIVNSKEKGNFVSFPSYKNQKEEYINICYPITADFRKELNEKILNNHRAAEFVKENEKTKNSNTFSHGSKKTKTR